jgi:FG-GAP-like repeat/FG-GAP repeat
LTLYLSSVVAVLFFVRAPLAYAQQGLPLPVAPQAETQEQFGANEIPSGNVNSQQGSAINGLQTTVGASPSIGGSGQFDFNNDGHPDYLLYNASNRRTVVWYMNNNIHFASHNGPNHPSWPWVFVSAADFNGVGHPDWLLFDEAQGRTIIWYMIGATFLTGKYGPTLPGGWEVVAISDFNGDGRPDLVLYRPSTIYRPSGETAIWYMNNNLHVGSATGPTPECVRLHGTVFRPDGDIAGTGES